MKTYREAIAESSRTYLRDVLKDRRGCVTKAAMIAGYDRTAFYKLLRRYRVDWRSVRRS